MDITVKIGATELTFEGGSPIAVEVDGYRVVVSPVATPATEPSPTEEILANLTPAVRKSVRDLCRAMQNAAKG